MLITMSDHEINRFNVLTDVQEKRLRQVDATDILNVSTRHVRRLLSQLATYGALQPAVAQATDAMMITFELKY
jgi:Fic family protein